MCPLDLADKNPQNTKLVWPFPQHTAGPPSPSVYWGSTNVLIETLLTVHYTNPWSLIPIIPAYCIAVNHSLDGKYKSFHLSLCSTRIIAASAPQKHSHGPSRAAQEMGSAVLDTLICSYSKQALTWQRQEGPRARLPSLTRQTQRIIRPLQPPPAKRVTHHLFEWSRCSCFLVDPQLWASADKSHRLLRFSIFLHTTTPQRFALSQNQVTISFRTSKHQRRSESSGALLNDNYSNLLLRCHNIV